jgi:phosphoribosylanthranilate isomerase
MNIKLKICGMRDLANIGKVVALRPDYMGFIFYDKSPRYVGENFEMPSIPDSIERVGVFVNQDVAIIIDTVKKYKLDFVQLHGTEKPEQCKELKIKGIKIIKVFSVDESFDFSLLKQYAGHVNYFLFDTKGKYFGGNAEVFDWNLLKQYDQQLPFFLSGGISVENIAGIQKLKNLNLHALDVNSGVEVLPGIKDVNKIKELKRTISSLPI